MFIRRTRLYGFQAHKDLRAFSVHQLYKSMLAGCALFLVACASSEELETPPEDFDNRILGLKVETIRFNTKRPVGGKVNPHDDTRVGTSVTIPLGLMGQQIMPLGLDQDLEDEEAAQADEPLPLESF